MKRAALAGSMYESGFASPSGRLLARAALPTTAEPRPLLPASRIFVFNVIVLFCLFSLCLSSPCIICVVNRVFVGGFVCLLVCLFARLPACLFVFLGLFVCLRKKKEDMSMTLQTLCMFNLCTLRSAVRGPLSSTPAATSSSRCSSLLIGEVVSGESQGFAHGFALRAPKTKSAQANY